MNISPDSIIYWQWGPIKLSATIVFTWVVMALLLLISWLVTRNISVETKISRWQHFLETLVSYIQGQIKDVVRHDERRYLPFIGSLFMFISLSNLLVMVPGYQPPTGSLYTTGGLALCVFFAIPIFGILKQGWAGYFKHYIQPTPVMLPFHIISEFSRTLSMAVRLFGNIMSGTMTVAILLSVAPLFAPVIMQVLGLLIGQIQAYIFAILAMVYIGSATRSQEQEKQKQSEKED